ncbi:ABC transporter permease subunit, partial [Pseudomonas shahriarae]
MRTFNQQFLRLVPSGRKLVIGIPFIWLFLFFMLPFFLVMKISFSEAALSIPPYSEIYTYAEQKFQLLLNIGNYTMLGEDELYLSAYLGSLKVAALSTLMCLVIGFPMAYAITKTGKETQNVLLLLIMMPTWTAILIRVYAWMGILSNNGLLNSFLMWTGLTDHSIEILNTNTAVYIGVVYAYLPFMVLPLYANLVKHDGSLLEAASDLGSSNFNNFWKITVPLAKNGIIAGCMLVF